MANDDVVGYLKIILQVSTVLILLVVIMMNSHPLVTAASCHCVGNFPSMKAVAQTLDCIPNLNGTCFGEEVKCLRNSLLQPLFNKVIGNWDDINTFFTPELDQVRATYSNSSLTPCPWEYVAENDSNRYPQYIHNVSCPPCNCANHYSMTGLQSCECRAVKYNVPILERITEQQWRISNKIVNVACVPHFILDNGQ